MTDDVVLTPEIIAEVEKYASLLKAHAELLEAAAKVRKASFEAHAPTIALGLHELYLKNQSKNRQGIPMAQVHAENDAFYEKVIAELRKTMDWTAIGEILEYQPAEFDPEDWEAADDPDNPGLDLLSFQGALGVLYQREQRREYNRRYFSNPEVKEQRRQEAHERYLRNKVRKKQTIQPPADGVGTPQDPHP